jgi:SAM-dependent methyltransferase
LLLPEVGGYLAKIMSYDAVARAVNILDVGGAASLSDADLALPRKKQRSVGISVTYRAMAVALKMLGPRRVLPLALDTAWLAHRLAFELSGEVLGSRFHCAAMGLSKPFIAKWLPPDATVLDVGCGTGRWSRIAARCAKRVVGIDLDGANLATAREAAAQEGLTNVQFLQADITRTLPEETFDVALLVHVIEHLEEPEGFLERVAQMAPTLIVEVPDFDANPLNVVRHGLGRRFYADADHVREYTVELLGAHLQRAGLQIHHCECRRGSIVAVARRV